MPEQGKPSGNNAPPGSVAANTRGNDNRQLTPEEQAAADEQARRAAQEELARQELQRLQEENDEREREIRRQQDEVIMLEERRQREERLRQEEEQSRALLEASRQADGLQAEGDQRNRTLLDPEEALRGIGNAASRLRITSTPRATPTSNRTSGDTAAAITEENPLPVIGSTAYHIGLPETFQGIMGTYILSSRLEEDADQEAKELASTFSIATARRKTVRHIIKRLLDETIDALQASDQVSPVILDSVKNIAIFMWHEAKLTLVGRKKSTIFGYQYEDEIIRKQIYKIWDAQWKEIQELLIIKGVIVPKIFKDFSPKAPQRISFPATSSASATSRVKPEIKDLPSADQQNSFVDPQLEDPQSKAMFQAMVNSSLVQMEFVSREDIPKFSGEPRDFQRYWQQFKAIVDDNPRLPKIVKLRRLEKSLQGEALEVVRNFSFDANNYDLIKNALKDRFGDSDRITRDLIRKLVKHPKIGNSSKELRAFIDKCSQVLNLIREGVQRTQPPVVFYAIIEEKLPPECLSQWQSELRIQERLGTVVTDDGKLDALLQFLDTYVETQRHIENLAKDSKEQRPSMFKRKPLNHQGKVFSRPRFVKGPLDNFAITVKGKPGNKSVNAQSSKQKAMVIPPSNGRCLFCQGNHAPQFCKMPMLPAERYKLVIQSKCCINCLCPGHIAGTCKRRPCGKFSCKRKHHHLLHRDDTKHKSA